MFLGIEIGGTKTQLGVSAGPGSELIQLVRLDVDREAGAKGILQSILREGGELQRRHAVRAVGVGFGGPVDAVRGATLTSHQVAGWERFPLQSFLQDAWRLPVALGNDCDSAALAEAVEGAGRGSRVVLYVTAGTGVGGGLVVDGRLLGRDQPAVAEIGHMRPGLECRDSAETVESLASGLGIAATTAALMAAAIDDPRQRRGAVDWSGWTSAAQMRASQCADTRRLLLACGENLRDLTTRHIADQAADGNRLARRAVDAGVEALGWAIAQAITLTAPQTVVVGGGLSLIDKALFADPLGQAVARYVFPPLADGYRLTASALGETVVVRGAILLARAAAEGGSG